MDYLAMISFNLNLVGMILAVGCGVPLLVNCISNSVNMASRYEENRVEYKLPTRLKVLFVIGLLIAVFVPSNMELSMVRDMRKDLNEQREQVLQANKQIQLFNLYLLKTQQVDRWTEFYNENKSN